VLSPSRSRDDGELVPKSDGPLAFAEAKEESNAMNQQQHKRSIFRVGVNILLRERMATKKGMGRNNLFTLNGYLVRSVAIAIFGDVEL
jgi:hypothetical protein